MQDVLENGGTQRSATVDAEIAIQEWMFYLRMFLAITELSDDSNCRDILHSASEDRVEEQNQIVRGDHVGQ